MKLDQIESHADARSVLARMSGHRVNEVDATLAIRRPVASYADLLEKLQHMTAQDLARPVTAHVELPAPHVSRPVGTVTHIELRVGASPNGNETLLHIDSNPPAFHAASSIALRICEVMGFALLESNDAWTYTTGTPPRSSQRVYEDKEDAAQAAVRKFFAKSDWKIEVENNDTHLGYFEWSLHQAYQIVDKGVCG